MTEVNLKYLNSGQSETAALRESSGENEPNPAPQLKAVHFSKTERPQLNSPKREHLGVAVEARVIRYSSSEEKVRIALVVLGLVIVLTGIVGFILYFSEKIKRFLQFINTNNFASKILIYFVQVNQQNDDY
jgi:hypothetical protein